MSSAQVTTAWARTVADELARTGVREVVLAPGSRSTPLVLAFAADGRFRLRVHLDERSAGFFALGVGKVSGVPAAVVTTSGTATANLYGAVIEAAQAEVPLLILTADRPHRLRGADANQAIDQTRLYGPYVRAFFETAPADADAAALRHLRALACRAVLATREAPAGPVHVNLPFDKPLEPPAAASGRSPVAVYTLAATRPLAATGRADGRPWVDATPSRRRAPAEALDVLRAHVAHGTRAVVVAGPSPEPARDGPAVLAFAAATGFPLLADPLSGARWGPPAGAPVVEGYDLFLRDAAVRARLSPTLVVRVGASPTSAALQTWLEQHAGGRQLVIDGGGRWKDHAAVASDYLHADMADTLRAITPEHAPPLDVGWADAWRAASAATRAELLADAGGAPHEGQVLGAVARTLPASATLFVSSSMPVRDLDAYGAPREETLRVYGNRGASGIDGIVSSAFGVSAASAGPVVCVLGDVALFHDQNGLLWHREEDAPVVFVLIDNDGGGIFHMLPVREQEPFFTPYFATPHGLDLAHAAALHGIPFEDAATAGVADALERAISAGGTRIVRVRSEREVNRQRHAEVVDAVTRSVRATLG